MRVFQLAVSSTWTSVVASLIGLTTGYLYRTDTLFPLPSFSRRRTFRPLKTYRIPLSLHVLLARLFAPLAGSPPPPRRSHRTLPGQVDVRASTAVAQAHAQAQSSIRSMLTTRLAAAQRQERPAAATAAATSPQGDGAAAATATTTATATTGGARQAMGEWVNEMTGRGSGARAPTEDEIATCVAQLSCRDDSVTDDPDRLTNMFPNMGRDTIVRALQQRWVCGRLPACLAERMFWHMC